MWNWTENQIRLVLIRHGATPANKEHRYLGKTDEPLSEEGIEELQKKKKKNLYPEVTELFSSPMKRCIQTAELIYPAKEPILIPEWTEMDFGDFEGKNYADLQGDKNYQAWIDSNGTLPFPGGESREYFIERCERGFYGMLEQFSEGACVEQANLTIGAIVHGGTIMALLSRFYGGEYFDYQVANGRGYICTLKGNMKVPQIAKLETLCDE